MSASPNRPPSPSRRRLRWAIFSVLVAVFAVALGAFSIYSLLVGQRKVAPMHLTITAGSAEGLRQQIAAVLGPLAEERKVHLEILPTSGSTEALRKVVSGEIDLALIQGGLRSSRFAGLREVAALHVEPLHLLVRGDLWNPDPEKALIALRGRTINTSTAGSGTRVLAHDLLAFVGMAEGLDFTTTDYSYDRLMTEFEQLEPQPDAVFLVSSLPSPVARSLIENHDFRLVELPFAQAYRLDWFDPRLESEEPRVARMSVVEATIPPYVYRIHPPSPPVATRTLGTRLHLVAHHTVNREAVSRICDAVYATSFAERQTPPLRLETLSQSAQFPMHEGARRYLTQKTPVVAENVIALTEQLLAIAGAAFGAILFFSQAFLFLRRRRRDRQFLRYIVRVGEIERQCLEYERGATQGIGRLIALQDELEQLKAEIIQQFQVGEIEGTETLSGFLIHLNDASENLMRLVLHARSTCTASSTDQGTGAGTATIR